MSAFHNVTDCSTGESVPVELSADELAEREERRVASLEPIVPIKVSTWRLHAVAEIQCLTTSIANAIAALPEPDRTVASAGWNRSFEMERNNALVVQLGAALGLSGAELDDLFRAAADLLNPTN